MIISTTIPESVRLRPGMYFNHFVRNGDLAKVLCIPLHILLSSFPKEELRVAITITDSKQIELELNHSLLDDLPIDLQVEYEHKTFCLLVLVGLFLDCVITNRTSKITFYEGKVVSKEEHSGSFNYTLINAQLDETIIPNPFFKPEVLADILKELSCFFTSHKYTLKYSEGENLQYFNTFYSPDGLLELFRYKLDYRLSSYFFHHGKQWLRWENPYDAVQFIEIRDEALNVKLNIAVAPFNNIDTHIISYSQYELTPLEGSHVDVLRRYLNRIKNKDADEHRKGYTCLVSFEGDSEHFSYPDSTKNRIEGPVLDVLMHQAIEQLDLW